MNKVPQKVTVRLMYSQRQALEKLLAKDRSRKLSWYVRKAIFQYLEELREKDMSDSQAQPSGDARASDITPAKRPTIAIAGVGQTEPGTKSPTKRGGS